LKAPHIHFGAVKYTPNEKIYCVFAGIRTASKPNPITTKVERLIIAADVGWWSMLDPSSLQNLRDLPNVGDKFGFIREVPNAEGIWNFVDINKVDVQHLGIL
jgi:hypothetical protein